MYHGAQWSPSSTSEEHEAPQWHCQELKNRLSVQWIFSSLMAWTYSRTTMTGFILWRGSSFVRLAHSAWGIIFCPGCIYFFFPQNLQPLQKWWSPSSTAITQSTNASQQKNVFQRWSVFLTGTVRAQIKNLLIPLSTFAGKHGIKFPDEEGFSWLTLTWKGRKG